MRLKPRDDLPPPMPIRLPENDPLVDALREYRRASAKRLNAPPWRVLPNATLLALAQRKPRNRAALRDISGMGPTRVRRHGNALLKILRSAP